MLRSALDLPVGVRYGLVFLTALILVAIASAPGSAQSPVDDDSAAIAAIELQLESLSSSVDDLSDRLEQQKANAVTTAEFASRTNELKDDIQNLEDRVQELKSEMGEFSAAVDLVSFVKRFWLGLLALVVLAVTGFDYRNTKKIRAVAERYDRQLRELAESLEARLTRLDPTQGTLHVQQHTDLSPLEDQLKRVSSGHISRFRELSELAGASGTAILVVTNKEDEDSAVEFLKRDLPATPDLSLVMYLPGHQLAPEVRQQIVRDYPDVIMAQMPRRLLQAVLDQGLLNNLLRAGGGKAA